MANLKIRKDKKGVAIVDLNLASKVLSVVDRGLVNGMGIPEPGKMCVEAAVAYASGEKHTDRPACVHKVLHSEKINLNDDVEWDSEQGRAKGLRRVAIAQLGTAKKFDVPKYRQLLCEETHKVCFPIFKENVLKTDFNRQAVDAKEEIAHFLSKIENVKEQIAVLQDSIKNLELQVKSSAKTAQTAKRARKSLLKCKDIRDLNKAIIRLNSNNLVLNQVIPCDYTIHSKGFDSMDCYYNLSSAFPDDSSQEVGERAAEALTQALKKMKTPGSRYLHLTEKKSKAKRK